MVKRAGLVLSAVGLVTVGFILSCVVTLNSIDDRRSVDEGAFASRIDRDLPVGSSEEEVLQFIYNQANRDGLEIFYCKESVAEGVYPVPSPTPRTVFVQPKPIRSAVTGPGLQTCSDQYPDLVPSEIAVIVTDTGSRPDICTLRFSVHFRIAPDGRLDDIRIDPDDACF